MQTLLSQSYLILAGLWIVWCILHSVLISGPVLRAVENQPWHQRRYYRLFFNVVSVVTFIPTIVYALRLEKEWIWKWEGLWWAVPWFLLFIAALLFIGGARHYDMKQFLGLRQLDRRAPARGLTETGQLETGGMLGLSRHPWYAGGIILLWAADLSKARLISNIILTVYLIAGTYLEERKLVDEYGDEYRMYQKRVPRLFPLGVLGRARRQGQNEN